MVTVFFRGGLGNQMFQYAFGLHLAKKNNTELRMDTVHVRDRFPRPHFTYRTFDLPEVFSVTPRLTPLSKIANALPLPGVWLGIDLLGMNLGQSMIGHAKILYENELSGFNANALSAQGNVVLYGRWESEKYFADSEDDVRRAFTFRHPLEGEAARIAEQMQTANSVSLHVRRGDFINFAKVSNVMGEVGPSYYEKAIAHIAERVKDPHFFIFSNDNAWTKENIKMNFPATYLDNSTAGPRGAFHLELMSRAKHNIITNSTFSWWGAWLNKNSGKIVVAPRVWAKSGRDAKDVVPDGWVKL